MGPVVLERGGYLGRGDLGFGRVLSDPSRQERYRAILGVYQIAPAHALFALRRLEGRVRLSRGVRHDLRAMGQVDGLRALV